MGGRSHDECRGLERRGPRELWRPRRHVVVDPRHGRDRGHLVACSDRESDGPVDQGVVGMDDAVGAMGMGSSVHVRRGPIGAYRLVMPVAVGCDRFRWPGRIDDRGTIVRRRGPSEVVGPGRQEGRLEGTRLFEGFAKMKDGMPEPRRDGDQRGKPQGGQVEGGRELRGSMRSGSSHAGSEAVRKQTSTGESTDLERGPGARAPPPPRGLVSVHLAEPGHLDATGHSDGDRRPVRSAVDATDAVGT